MINSNVYRLLFYHAHKPLNFNSPLLAARDEFKLMLAFRSRSDNVTLYKIVIRFYSGIQLIITRI
jgi:hypothetical protein